MNTDFTLTTEELLNAILSYRKDSDEWEIEDWDEWGEKPFTAFGALLNGTKKNFSEAIGNTVSVRSETRTLVIKLVHVQFQEPVAEIYAYGDESLFPQGWEGEGFIIFEFNDKTYRKGGYQNSYGSIRMDDEAVIEVKPLTKVIEVWA